MKEVINWRNNDIDYIFFLINFLKLHLSLCAQKMIVGMGAFAIVLWNVICKYICIGTKLMLHDKLSLVPPLPSEYLILQPNLPLNVMCMEIFLHVCINVYTRAK